MIKKQKGKRKDIRIINSYIKRLSILEEEKMEIVKVQRKIIKKTKAVLDRFCDDRDIKRQAEQNEEVYVLLHQAKDLISKLRTLV